MKDIILYEIRECNKAISQIEDAKKIEYGNKMLLETVNKMCELSRTAKRGGLFAIEEAANELSDDGNYKHLKYMIGMIVNGATPELLEELCMIKYFSSTVPGYEALQYLIMMVGSLNIQAGENPKIIEAKLTAMFPWGRS